jgi:ankyrin repeat protein
VLPTAESEGPAAHRKGNKDVLQLIWPGDYLAQHANVLLSLPNTVLRCRSDCPLYMHMRNGQQAQPFTLHDLQAYVRCGLVYVSLCRLSAGADPLLQDADGETPLHKAAAQGHAAVAAALLMAGPTACSTCDKRDLTPQERATGAAKGIDWPEAQHQL